MKYPPKERDAGYAQFARIAHIVETHVFAGKTGGQNCHARRDFPEGTGSICSFYADWRDGDVCKNRWSVSMRLAPNHVSTELYLTVAGQHAREIWSALESVIEPDRMCKPSHVELCIDDELDGSDTPDLLIPHAYRTIKEPKAKEQKDCIHEASLKELLQRADTETDGM